MNTNRNEVAELPPYRALVVVDVRNFSGEKGRDHEWITKQIPVILEQALIRCGLGELWQKVCFGGSTGDGYFLGLESKYLPFLLNPFLPALQAELEYQNRVSPDRDRQHLRMRVSVTVGPMTDSGENGISEGSGVARIEAHRMVDDASVRDMLTRSNDTTCVAAIVSSRAYEDAVVSGYAADDPDLYVPVDVAVKTHRGTGYLRVPKPSGDLLSRGFTSPEPPEAGGPGDVKSAEGTGPGSPSRTVEQHFEKSTVGIGAVQGNVGKAITGDNLTVHTGSGDQFNAPLGDGVNVIGTNRGRIRHQINKGGDAGDGR
ncbi:hypothetical protein [Saccharopolyspora pogona]|uniref:hypothetical protein n=1 Tax=Saccharopolyspora pogona TaxID=333966 RepID=UPI0016849B85|nr:hypothetical protein [Saccharopolyspora pogona]